MIGLFQQIFCGYVDQIIAEDGVTADIQRALNDRTLADGKFGHVRSTLPNIADIVTQQQLSDDRVREGSFLVLRDDAIGIREAPKDGFIAVLLCASEVFATEPTFRRAIIR